MGSRQERRKLTKIQQQTLDNPELRAALNVLCQLFSTCAGPHGYIKAVQNNVGGPLVLTSCSSRLLGSMSFSHPCIRLIISSVRDHLKNHHDGGLLAGSLCLHLINSALSVENVSRRFVRNVFDVLLDCVDNYLNGQECPVRVNVDTSNVKVMLRYVRSIVSKPACGLHSASLEYFSQLMLRVFVSSVPDTPKTFLSDRILILQFPSNDVMTSEVREGLLLECPEISTLRGKQDLHIRTSCDGMSAIQVVLITVSMSGDAEEAVEMTVEAAPEVIDSASEFVISKMVALCDWLVQAGAGLLLCQKVIHPRVKSYLRMKGVLFVDRIGIQPMAYIQDLTGAVPVGSVLVTPSMQCFGHLTAVAHCIIHGKSYLHLQQAGSCVNTLLLCARLEEQVAELNAVVRSAMKGLYSVLHKQQVLCGGGCWQIHLADFTRRIVEEKSSELTSLLHVSKARLTTAAAAFASSLESTARSLLMEHSQAWVNAEHCHVWHFPKGVDATQEPGPFRCGCGLLGDADIDKNNLQQLAGLARSGNTLEQQKRFVGRKGPLDITGAAGDARLVLDTPNCVMSAVRTAVTTACTVLSISQYVYDTN